MFLRMSPMPEMNHSALLCGRMILIDLDSMPPLRGIVRRSTACQGTPETGPLSCREWMGTERRATCSPRCAPPPVLHEDSSSATLQVHPKIRDSSRERGGSPKRAPLFLSESCT